MDPIYDALVLARWVHFGAVVVLFGGAVFRAIAPGASHAAQRFERRSLRIAASLALLSGAGWLAAMIVVMTGPEGLSDPQTLHAFFFETLFGPIVAARTALLVFVVILAFAPMRAQLQVACIGVASGLLLVSQAWLGHAAEGGDTLAGFVMIAVYAVHVLAGAAWLGGLPPLLARIAQLRRTAAPPWAHLQLLSRYSLMAAFAVALVLASGIANAAFRVGAHFGAFVATAYGDVLLSKVALVGIMLAFAAYNRLVAMPRLRGTDGASTGLVTSIGCEIGLGLLVLLAAAVLGITPPPLD